MTTLLPSRLSISTGSPEPIYRQLVEQVRRMVAGGQLCVGDEMPSVREVAQALAVNPMTVSKAYALLEMDGVLLRRRGLPMQIAKVESSVEGVQQRRELLRPSLERVAREALELGVGRDELLALFEQTLQAMNAEDRHD